MQKKITVTTVQPSLYNANFPLPELENFQVLPLDRKNLDFEQLSLLKDSDILLMENNLEHNKLYRHYPQIFEYVRESGKPWIVVEAAVFRKNHVKPPDPGAYYRWSWFSYFADAGNYCNANSPDDRWRQIQQEQGIEIHPWRSRESNILFMMQRPGDTSLAPALDHWGSYQNFIEVTIQKIRQHTDRPIRIRLHPQRHNMQIPLLENVLTLPDVKISEFSDQDNQQWVEGGKSLQKDLNRSWAVVGLNSNSLTETVCMGIPTWSLHPSSLAWPVSHHDLRELESPRLDIDRDQWLYDLGYTQWRYDEVIEGLPWQHLMKAWPAIQERRFELPDWSRVLQNREIYIEENYLEHYRREYFLGEVRRARVNKELPKKF